MYLKYLVFSDIYISDTKILLNCNVFSRLFPDLCDTPSQGRIGLVINIFHIRFPVPPYFWWDEVTYNEVPL